MSCVREKSVIIKKVALTGGRGMTGMHVKALLDEEGITCLDLDRKSWDLSEWKTVSDFDEILGEVDAVLHVGAAVPSRNNPLSSGQLFDANVRACVALAEWALERQCPVVFLSGSTVYEKPHNTRIKECDAKTTNNFGGFYGFTKYLAEQVFEHYSHKGLKLVTLRPSSIYGTGLSQGQLIDSFLNSAREGKTLTIEYPGDNAINFVHASDVARAMIVALQKQAWGVYNIGSSQNTAIQELAEFCTRLTGKGEVKITFPDGWSDKQPFLRYDLDSSKAHDAFGYVSRVSIREGLEMMLNNQFIWFGKS